ncbi:HtaA domain-containing protein [Pseudoclavibacter helvolus]|uniref:HtaA domain-containing protein n=1 Tax=Pseudoclavibacter helvolus TaxID=255205 RepID=UPI0037366082
MELWRGELRWPIKSSFVEYVRRSGGDVHMEGGAFVDDEEFGYPRGVADSAWLAGDAPVGSASFVGAVRLTGHGGMLDVTFRNPQLVFDGEDARLVVQGLDGAPIDFASCEIGTPLVRDDVAEWLGVRVILTPAGSQVFNGMYRPYSEMDSLNFTLALGRAQSPREERA